MGKKGIRVVRSIFFFFFVSPWCVCVGIIDSRGANAHSSMKQVLKTEHGVLVCGFVVQKY